MQLPARLDHADPHARACFQHACSAIMSRILLADDSPQALRLGEQILSGQGIEVVSVTDGAVALRRLSDVNPDVFITDLYLPTKNGFELARFMKADPGVPRYSDPLCGRARRYVRRARRAQRRCGRHSAQAFEASALLDAVQTLLEKRAQIRKNATGVANHALDRATIRAAVTLALDAAMPVLIEELTERVVLALSYR